MYYKVDADLEMDAEELTPAQQKRNRRCQCITNVLCILLVSSVATVCTLAFTMYVSNKHL